MLQRLTLMTPAQDIDPNAPHYWPGLSKQHTDSVLAYVATAEQANPFFGAPLVPIEETRPVTITGNGKLPPDAFDNLDSLEF